MSVNVETNTIDVEYILRDVMDIIVSYLGIKDLASISSVCTSWRNEALREEAKRRYIKQLRLPRKFCNWESTLDSNLRVSLIFYKHRRLDKYEDLYVQDQPEELLKDSLKQLSHKTIALGVDTYLTTKDTEFSTTTEHCELEQEGICDILDFFLLNMGQQTHVQVACVPPVMYTDDDDHKKELYEAAVNNVIEELGLNECESTTKSTIILCFNAFGPTSDGGEPITSGVFDRIQSSNTDVIVFSVLKIFSVGCEKESRKVSPKCMAAIRISGANVESWSTMIHNTALIDEIEEKIQELKVRVKPRRSYTGLIFGFRIRSEDCSLKCSHIKHPACDKQKIMHLLKRFFPDVPFTGIFNCAYPIFMHNGIREEIRSFCSKWMAYVTIMIISHDN